MSEKWAYLNDIEGCDVVALYTLHNLVEIVYSKEESLSEMIELWNQAFQKGKTQQEYNELYYQEILKVIQKYKDYCVLGHLDMINRYDQKGIYPFNKVFDLVNEILKQVINDHKGIEINTSCYRYGLKDLTPSVEILKLYKKLGGDIITIGSDGHDVDQYGFKIQETKQILKDLGFKYIYTFDKMKPIVHTI